MDLETPDLPINFPCWVRAQYSWGGETKRDLGFLEGDLIECLNAGDGSWWTGRLRRDPRLVGSFPSNFVKVLDASYQPPTRNASPLPSRQPSPSPSTQSAKPQKSFRRPFQAYHHAPAPNPEAAARETQAKNGGSALNSPAGSQRGSQRSSRKPFSSMMNKKPDVRPTVESQRSSLERPISRAAAKSPIPRHTAPSPRPDQIARLHALEYRRSFREDTNSPPPPPPPHRYNPSRAPSPQPPRHMARTPEPRDEGDEPHKHTPSPFTAAYADIMDTFKDMTVKDEEDGEDHDDGRPKSIYCPDDFEKIYPKRPHTSMAATHTDSGYGTGFDEEADTQENSSGQLDDYIPRMEKRLRKLQDSGWKPRHEEEDPDLRPPLPAKDSNYDLREQGRRPPSAFSLRRGSNRLKKQKSAYELGRDALSRTFTTKTNSTNVTNSSNNTAITDRSLMSASSIGNYSVKSAGSFYRRKLGFARGNEGGAMRPMSSVDFTTGNVGFNNTRPHTPSTPGVSFGNELHSESNPGLLGGLTNPSPKRAGFFRKMIDSARAGAATARVAIATSRPGSPTKMSTTSNGFAGGMAVQSRPQSSVSRDMDWVQVRRDLYRSNSITQHERQERSERCQMLDISVIAPVDELMECAEGVESLDGLPVSEPVDFSACNLALVDKSARFVSNVPPFTTPTALVQGYLCRPYRSDVQRLRAIFTWVSERISWEEDFEGDINLGRVMQTKRGCSEEIAHLVVEMCGAVGIHSEIVHGLLKIPGEPLDLDLLSRPNHFWNAVIVDGEWRILDCSLASPTNCRRAQFSTIRSPIAENFWFLTNPIEAAYSHVPLMPEQQHIIPPVPSEILLSLPCACPSYFQHGIGLYDFDTSLIHLDNLELAQIQFVVPEDVEIVAEMETRAFARDIDGDVFENGDVVSKSGLAQVEWYGGQKRYTIKAVLPSDEGHGVLKVYAGKRGLMVSSYYKMMIQTNKIQHSIKSNPHPLALSLPISHTGSNPPYSFLTRHPTPHAQRHDLYVAQPQCARLAANNTFVFTVRQHPASLTKSPSVPSNTTFGNVSFSGRASPNPLMRPASAMSIASVSQTGSNYSNQSNGSNSSGASSGGVSINGGIKPAKLAIQTPGGKIIRLTRKVDGQGKVREGGEVPDGSEWETVIKVGERGIWRGLVLADRSARWCVFAEWECV
jgi:transglutaminase/protease-like cytokinesis protein 3